MAKITSRGALEAWFKKHNRADFAQVIAARAALRVLPYSFTKDLSDKWVATNSPVLFHASFLSWAASNLPVYGMEAAANSIADAAQVAFTEAADTLPVFGRPGAQAIYSISRAVIAAADNINAAPSATDAVLVSSNAAMFMGTDFVLWENLNHDCNWLASARDPTLASRLLTREPLWPAGEPDGWREIWDSATKRLAALNQGYSVWIDWYNRRLKGEDAAFDIPGDSDRAQDIVIITRLPDGTNEDFWDKGAAYVNTTLQSWIDEARERVKPLSVIDPNLEPRPQNPDALVWQSDEASRIGVDALSGADALDYSDEARDRHSEARDEAQRVRALCATSDAAYEIGGLLDRYLEAMGETIEGVRPGLFVQRGERLRQALTSRIADGNTSNYGPLPDQVRDGLKGWQSAHNAFVGLDAKLARIDSALYGPDARRSIVPPDEIRAVAKSADEAAILQPGGREALEGAAAIAPTPPDADDRRSRLSSETAKNFGRKVLSVLWFGIQGGTVSYAIGHWVVANAAWFRTWFADDPATLAVVERILDLLSKLPLS